MIRYFAFLGVSMLLAGCFSFTRAATSAIPEGSEEQGAAGILENIGIYGMFACGALMVLCVIVGFSQPGLRVRVVRYCIGLAGGFITSAIMHRIGTHWGLVVTVTIITTVLTAAIWAFGRRHLILYFTEKLANADLNKDGVVGNPLDPNRIARRKLKSAGEIELEDL